jgi:hypothetical protein
LYDGFDLAARALFRHLIALSMKMLNPTKAITLTDTLMLVSELAPVSTPPVLELIVVSIAVLVLKWKKLSMVLVGQLRRTHLRKTVEKLG